MCSKAKECTSKIIFSYTSYPAKTKYLIYIHTIELQRYKWAYKFTIPQFKSKYYSKILVGAQ